MSVLAPISRKPLSFVLPIVALVGALVGLLVGSANGAGGTGAILGLTTFAGLAAVAVKAPLAETMMRWSICVVFLVVGFMLGNIALSLLGVLIGAFTGWFIFWLYEGRYRAKLLPYLTPSQVFWHYSFRVVCGAIFVFLISPIIVVMPLSFNAQDFFTFTEKMLALDPDGYS
ncbi:MAG: ABC transporter permease, partial [Pseudomonadota bacterium]|nr:ABC transporter permease [Pseudomonadota bacterium]